MPVSRFLRVFSSRFKLNTLPVKLTLFCLLLVILPFIFRADIIEPDYRSTLYWEPNITTNQNGKANVSFYTSDIKDGYTIKISGVDITGGIGDGSFKLNQSKK